MQKFIKVAAMLLVLGAIAVNITAITFAANVSIINGNFESSPQFTGWNAGTNWTWDSSVHHGGNKAARVKGSTDSNSILSQSPISTNGYNNISVSFWYNADDDSLESEDYVKAEYTTNGTTWTTFYIINDSNDSEGWHQVSYNSFPSNASNNPNFGIRFRANLNSASNDRVTIDDVSISGDQIVYKSLNVSKTGDGSVSSAPTGINCGNDCNESYLENTVVTLTATPATGSEFTGWGGACSGTGTCTVTMSATKTVTATFDTIKTTITATKVVCNSESDLPNWGSGGADITATTATDYVAAHSNCHLEKDWNFEWALYSVSNPGDNAATGGGPAGQYLDQQIILA